MNAPKKDGAEPASGPPALGESLVIENAWRVLRRHTPARIALGRTGVSLPTAPQLALQLAHAQARDAVHRPLDAGRLAQAIEALGLSTVQLHTAAADRSQYLQRPDLGRQLDPASRELLQSASNRCPAAAPGADLAIAVVDGLSALAVERHAVPLLKALLPRLRPGREGWTLAPVTVVLQGRVAVGDEIGALLRARLIVVLIGERPGLSSPDSLGAYMTWSPRRGRNDAERNCISNIRPQGLAYGEAALRLCFLLEEARRRQLSGVALKDESDREVPAAGQLPAFLLGSALERPRAEELSPAETRSSP